MSGSAPSAAELAEARACVQRQDFSAADAVLARTHLQESSEGQLLLAQVRFGQGRPFDAQVHLEKAFALDPGNLDAARRLLEFYLDAVMLVPAEGVLNKLAESGLNFHELYGLCRDVARAQANAEPLQQQFWRTFVPSGALVYDVGANIGAKAEWFLQLGAKVVCIEPQPDCLAVLREKFGKDTRVVIEEVGLAEKLGKLELNICAEGNTVSTFAEEWKNGRFANLTWDKKISVCVITFDQLIEKRGLPQFCKIDVEGFELSVLRGLTKPIPFISFEFAAELKNNTRQCVEYLSGLGYQHFNVGLGEKPLLHFPEWITAEALLAFIENSKDTWLWGDIYAHCGDAKPAAASSPASRAQDVDPKACDEVMDRVLKYLQKNHSSSQKILSDVQGANKWLEEQRAAWEKSATQASKYADELQAQNAQLRGEIERLNAKRLKNKIKRLFGRK